MTLTKTLCFSLLLAWLTPAAAAQKTSGDIVRLKDGGMVRGTIIEVVAGKTVSILSLAGERRSFPSSDVEYAGPEGGALPSPTEGAPASEVGVATVAPAARRPGLIQIIPSEPGLQLLRRTARATVTLVGAGAMGAVATGTFDDLCTSPCKVALEPGQHSLALARPGTVPLEGTIQILPETREVYATYRSNKDKRVAGWLAFAAMLGGGTALFVGSLGGGQDSYPYSHSDIDLGQLLAGTLLMAASAIPAFTWGVTPDEGLFSLTPPMPRSSASRAPATAAVR